MNKKIKKPPIGLTPHYIYKQQIDIERLNDISEAINRYYNAGRTINLEWIKEYNSLIEKLNTNRLNKREKECRFTLKIESNNKQFALKAFQPLRGLRDEDKRPNLLIIDCYKELDQEEVFKLSKYLQEIAYCMSNK